MEVQNKINFNERTFYKLNLAKEMVVVTTNTNVIKKGEIIAKFDNSKLCTEVKCKGKIIVKENDEIKKGDILSKTGFILEHLDKSPCDGLVISIDEEKGIINIKKKESLIDNVIDKKDLVSSFDTPIKIERNYRNRLLISLPSVNMNLFRAKGKSVIGKSYYVTKEILSESQNLDILKEKIVVLDYLHDELYFVLSSLGVKGIVTNSIDYYLYKSIVLLSVPIGIYGAFGKISFDHEVQMLLKKHNDKEIIFDAINNRVIFPESKNPAWVLHYKFNLEI